MIKCSLSIILLMCIISIIIYLIHISREYISQKNKVVAFIDFVITEDTLFEVLFIMLIAFIIVYFQ